MSDERAKGSLMGKLTWFAIVVLVFVAFPAVAIITLGLLAAVVMGGGLSGSGR
ncbi:MAG: hypothetical protein ACO3RB_09275 [Ilumatobacteraceae bacterium]